MLQPNPLEQNTLRTRHLPLLARHPRGSHPDSPGNSLERTLRLVVVILTPQHIHVHSHARTLGERLQDMRDHLGAEVA